MGTHHFQTRQYVYLVDRSSFCRVKQSCFPLRHHLCKPCFLRLRQEHTGNQNMIVRIQRKQDSATLMSLIFDCLVPLFPHFPLTPQCSVCPVCLGIRSFRSCSSFCCSCRRSFYLRPSHYDKQTKPVSPPKKNRTAAPGSAVFPWFKIIFWDVLLHSQRHFDSFACDSCQFPWSTPTLGKNLGKTNKNTQYF